jgi:hypothetical protein
MLTSAMTTIPYSPFHSRRMRGLPSNLPLK